MRNELPLFHATLAQREENSAHPYPVVSLFSGAMGLDIGLEQAGLRTVVAQDIDRWCVETIRRNGHLAIDGDLRTLLADDPQLHGLLDSCGMTGRDIFAVVGGPPCQPFSTAGKRLGVTDSRGQLYEHFVQVVRQLRPRFFVMENVKGLASMRSVPGDADSPPVLNHILQLFNDAGYRTVHGVLDAVHYGAPQFRERLVIIGSRDAEAVFLPAPSHFPFHQDPALRWRTLGDALEGLPETSPHAKFSSTIQNYLNHVPEGGNWKNLPESLRQAAMGGAYESGGGKVGFYRRLTRSEPAPTLVTSPVQKATLLGHPTQLRPLSVREYARVQGFPDDWKFEGSLSDCYRQIGNAVPVSLGRAIGQVLVATAQGSATVKVKRMRGTSVHQRVTQTQKLQGHIN
ncbi:MAG: DNA cytosine methyltransferase [Ottowia sp.]|nr:DNA cytosine methyltransferase [Ottowia sp.]